MKGQPQEPGPSRDAKVCRHPLLLSDDKRWASCNVCGADWPASAILASEIVRP